MPFVVASVATCTRRVAQDLDRCAPLAQIPSVLQTLEANKDGKNLSIEVAIRETRNLLKKAIGQLTIEGADAVTDTWVSKQPPYGISLQLHKTVRCRSDEQSSNHSVRKCTVASCSS